jgi:hypothetical protein
MLSGSSAWPIRGQADESPAGYYRAAPGTLRHAFITAALDAGVPLRDVQEAASHADPRTTMRYDRARTSLDRHATLHRRRLLHSRRVMVARARPRASRSRAKHSISARRAANRRSWCCWHQDAGFLLTVVVNKLPLKIFNGWGYKGREVALSPG